MSPETRTNAEKILYELQKEQTNGFEMGYDVDNGAIALKVIEQNLELLEALQEVLPMLEHLLMIRGEPEPGSIGHKARAAIAKATGQSK